MPIDSKRVEVLFCIQCGHTAKTCRRYRLSIDVIRHVSRGKNPGHASSGSVTYGATVHRKIAVLHRYLLSENIGVGLVPDSNEHAR